MGIEWKKFLTLTSLLALASQLHGQPKRKGSVTGPELDKIHDSLFKAWQPPEISFKTMEVTGPELDEHDLHDALFKGYKVTLPEEFSRIDTDKIKMDLIGTERRYASKKIKELVTAQYKVYRDKWGRHHKAIPLVTRQTAEERDKFNNAQAWLEYDRGVLEEYIKKNCSGPSGFCESDYYT